MSAWLDKSIAGGLIVVAVLMAVAHGGVDEFSVVVFELSMLVLLLLWAIKVVVERRLTITIPAPALPIVGLLVFGLLQSVVMKGEFWPSWSLSVNVEATRRTVTGLFCLLAGFVVAANFLASRERLSALAHFLAIYGLAMAVFALAQHFTWNGRLYWVRPTASDAMPFGPFVYHNLFAGYMELLIPVPVALIITRGVRGGRVLFGFAAAMMIVAVVVSLSRGGMISTLAELMFVAALGVRLRRERAEELSHLDHLNQGLVARLARIGAVAVMIAAVVGGVVWVGAGPVVNRIVATQVGAANSPQAETFFTSRGWMWKDALRMIRANPWLGVGLGAYQTAFPRYTQGDGLMVVDTPHNDYLQLLAEAGLVGGALAVWFIVSVFRLVARGLRSRDPLYSGLALGCGAGILALLVHSLVDFNLQIPSTALLFLLLSAVASHIGAEVVEREAEGALRHPARARAADLATGVSS